MGGEFKDFRRSEDSAEAGRRILMIFVLRPVSYSYCAVSLRCIKPFRWYESVESDVMKGDTIFYCRGKSWCIILHNIP